MHEFTRHPRIAARAAEGPPKTVDTTGLGDRIGLKITGLVGTMACAVLFAGIALVSLPTSLKSGSTVVIVSWVAQTFLQLVLLSIIIVGQNVQSRAADKRSQATYDDADAILHTTLQIQDHLLAQDAEIAGLRTRLDASCGPNER